MATQNEIADHLSLTSRHVRTLVKSGILPAGKRGLDIDDCRDAYIQYLRGKVSGRVTVRSEDELDGEQERARLNHHRANLAALDEQVRAGELVEIEAVAETVGAEYANVRAKLLSLPSKAAPLIGSLSTTEAHSTLDNLIREALEELISD